MALTVQNRSSSSSTSLHSASPAIEILGPWLLNKGDVLNLHALHQRLGERCRLAVSSNLGLPVLPASPNLLKIRWRPNLQDFSYAARKPSVKGGLSLLRRGVGLRLASTESLQRRRILDGKQLSGLIDCSGFAYGDQWPPYRMRTRARYYQNLKARGVTLVLLPQAFGPFEKPTIREAATDALRPFDRIYARDETSLQHLLTLDLEPKRIHLAPDITHLVPPEYPENPEEWSNVVCIVPNARMIDKAPKDQAEAYFELMRSAIQQAQNHGFDTRLVLHEENDRPLAEELQKGCGTPPPLYDDSALQTKGHLASSHAVIGSRYHALLSSLSQGTPAIGTSWNHKYEAMFSDYECPNLVIKPDLPPDQIREKIDTILDPSENRALRQSLQSAAKRQKEKVESMWKDVETRLDIES
ncbi:polysaccharide pyruvyl transferase family protein [Pelagicoccus sp. SDUM812002]|uniref:polysaccharide pyruvyl transferase family protein n=1 Tax=Pelagicoccus sp. SDUM812002 TaxID=3041266 RepID=UPI00281030EF|nr:polysaccharide pyruvyl transferase family protein [Pelagicoccus sp. SDUM812002]MDQ8184961.1 polysaccharide pyruvyl transferase family protein [Pelagicoccus sp. SDUM812002]